MSDTHSCSGSCSSFWSFVKIIVGILFFGLLTGYVLCKYRANNQTYDQTRAVERTKKLADLRAKEAAILDSYGVVDEVKGVYRIPISKAMELETEALKSKTVRAAGVIPVK